MGEGREWGRGGRGLVARGTVPQSPLSRFVVAPKRKSSDAGNSDTPKTSCDAIGLISDYAKHVHQTVLGTQV